MVQQFSNLDSVMGTANHSKNSVMEAENHVKHGASSKSQMSRGNQNMKMVKFFASVVFASFLVLTSCSRDTDVPIPNEPEVPGIGKEIELAIRFNFETSEEPMSLRSSTGDLFGVQIMEVPKNHEFPFSYACGVFDDLDQVKFKFVEGQTYSIYVNYFPNAKSILYQYPDGKYGIPFRSMWGHADYKQLNEPLYTTGLENQAFLLHLMEDRIETEATVLFSDCPVGTTLRYFGLIKEVTITENTSLEAELKQYMTGLKFKVKKFNEGRIKIEIDQNSYYINSDEEEITTKIFDFQLPFDIEMGNGQSREHSAIVRAYYEAPTGEIYMLLSSLIVFKRLTYHVFEFSIGELPEGGIGIILEGDQEYEEEPAEF